MKNKIYDCITFFQENLQFELRFNILKEVVDKFIVCESIFDHRGNKKKINFDKENYSNFADKIDHIILEEPFPQKNIPWENQALQREYIFEGLKNLDDSDLVMFSDPDEIPNPDTLKNLILKKKYGIFIQDMFTYKFNIYNKFESPWEGTRICKKKDLKSVDWLRQKVVSKNLKYLFWRFDKEKSIQIINKGGWHFNYLLTPEQISKKLRSLAETRWDKEEFYSVEKIKNKIKDKIDLFDRGHTYKRVEPEKYLPKFIMDNKSKYLDWID
jgi:beta-1,4-mannosyl-glycoprotein beta-1,4-N-acetylglucosaminyltransferase